MAMVTPSERVCLVIGTGDGLSSSIGEAFASKGMTVWLKWRTDNLTALKTVADKIRSTVGKSCAL